MIHLAFNPSLQAIPAAEILERAAQMTLEQQAVEGDLSVLLTDDAQLQEMNRTYLGVDEPTDVLAFPAAETDPDSGRLYLGDVVISVPRAALQAGAAGHSLEAELQLLVVHGLLHLLGHDHSQGPEKARMWAAQGAVLERLGLGELRLPE